MFKKLENNKPFLKMAFEGFAGDGKSYTAAIIAIGVHKLCGSNKPIAIFDTEKAFKALKFLFDEAGIEAIVNDEARSLASLHEAIKWCEEGGADVLIIDSITHVWENYVEAYKESKPRNKSFLEFQDWGIIKPKWKREFSTPFVQAKCHIIFNGRAGYEYSDEKNEHTGKREIYKSGIKMKAEGETAFEPDILVLMEKQMDLIGEVKSVCREATIIKDRTTRIDGKVFKNPTFEDFYPAIKQLLDGKLKETTGGEIPDTFEDFENKYSAIAREKEKVINEIEGAFKLIGWGTGAADQKSKSWCVKRIFNINSAENLGTINVEKLKEGLSIINEFAEKYAYYQVECLEKEAKADPKEVDELMKKVIDDFYAFDNKMNS